VTLWGLAFGGAATLFQTAMVIRAKAATDIAQSMLVTVWNLAIAGGGVLGGIVLQHTGTGGFTPSVALTAGRGDGDGVGNRQKPARVSNSHSSNSNATSRSARSVICCAHCE
jgi:hypothetical protein